MRFFGETRIDFLSKRHIAAAVSLGFILASIVSLVLQGGPVLGIDFAGGSQIVVRFASEPDLADIRDALNTAGLTESQIQEFEQGSAEILIRTPSEQGEEAEVEAAINDVLEAYDPPPTDAAGKLDLNDIGREQLGQHLMDTNPLELDTVVELEATRQRYLGIADRIISLRNQTGLLNSWEQISEVGLDTRVQDFLRQSCYLGGHRVVNVEWVGPQVGRDLRNQAMQAMIWALLGLLAYISYRFEFRFGVAAVVALLHDVTIAVGAFSVTGREFNLPVIAAFLTIVGYSLNDTVVVFDRIRENSQVMRREPVYDRINAAINQTLSRTVLTSGTTLVVVLSLYLYGGPVINDFAFALLVGVIVGTYSSIFVASPVVFAWQRWAARRAGV